MFVYIMGIILVISIIVTAIVFRCCVVAGEYDDIAEEMRLKENIKNS